MSENFFFTGRYFILVAVYFITSHDAFSQIVQLGFKSGYQLSWVRSDDPDFRARTKISPVSGYNAGLVATFKVKERYFLHTEYLYSTKGKRVSEYITPGGKPDPELEDKITYTYIDVPILYNVQFKGNMGADKHFKWYVGIGPIFSYWLGGKGTLKSQELRENEFDKIEYKIRFGDRPSGDGVTYVYMDNDAKRFQLGLTFGGGLLLEPPNNNSKVMIDLRFELGHRWMGKENTADYLAPSNYDDNIKGRSMGLRFSIMYLFEFNTDKKVRKKGKSTKKIRRL